MGRAKDELIKEQDRANHLERCMKCNAVLRTWEEREIAVCESCLKHSIEKD
ncbi:hypothetical protein V7152_23470 [Neobacillus drentensis]|uniref:hypothetical protein n=1 Tax=Neobacillus drentensis TaxID=220684 RepID=UPI002FFD921E